MVRGLAVDLDALTATPDAFAAALDRLGAERFTMSPAPGEWSAAAILLHVRAADAVISPRVLQIVTRPGVALADFDERAVGALLLRVGSPPAEQVASLRRRRDELVALLVSLTDDELALTGEHETRGTVTVEDVCRALVDHEGEHLQQLDAAVQACSS